MAKPVVDGLERDFGSRMDVVRVDITTDAGAALADRYGVHAVPAFVLVDPRGGVLHRQVGGRPDAVAIARLVSARGPTSPPPQ